jgi:hypothetical protein
MQEVVAEDVRAFRIGNAIGCMYRAQVLFWVFRVSRARCQFIQGQHGRQKPLITMRCNKYPDACGDEGHFEMRLVVVLAGPF